MFVRMTRKVDILRHEAGHLVIGKLLGFETGEIALDDQEARAGISLTPNLPDVPAAVGYVKRRVTVLYAGVLAECLRAGKVDEQLAAELLSARGTASNDHAKVRELLRVLAGFLGCADNPDIVQDLANQMHDHARALVEKYATEIHRVSTELSQLMKAGDTLTKEQVDDLPAVRVIMVGSEQA
ncbi:hypothetical protein FJN17_07760 [Bradyrhizobium symbiodeficiens]|uniref:Peptidase M41 domain-containing protein n=1 Tax=Bradyrhizobium symbiodeficiens TaxID=1404367 RepID=A0ABX5W3A9_9BRAD|nr:hypothetical protein [Bradyrhizobium symbiodeficiens]QDF37472.1 hypothetical protein FJN17_07760 [Bradyrhizobium symbiodeficiens]